MGNETAIVVVGTFDSKGEEHLFIARRIRERGMAAVTMNVGTRRPAAAAVDLDCYGDLAADASFDGGDRDQRIEAMRRFGRRTLAELHRQGRVAGVISAGGGTGTHLCSQIMRALPMGIPKVMVSTVASRDMAPVVGTSDITMMHSVTDILGVNSITGAVLDRAAAAVCAMAGSHWRATERRKRIALSFFGFITPAAETVRQALEDRGYEVVPFHANGTGGMAMMELARQGVFHGILDLATHELADAMMGGYCGGIGPDRYAPIPGRALPRLIVPGGMDCAVLEFTRERIPEAYRGRKIFFYDFRSAVRLSVGESTALAGQLARQLNRDADNVRVLVPVRGFSEADRQGAPLYDPDTGRAFVAALEENLDPAVAVEAADLHINDADFGIRAAKAMDGMIAAASR